MLRHPSFCPRLIPTALLSCSHISMVPMRKDTNQVAHQDWTWKISPWLAFNVVHSNLWSCTPRSLWCLLTFVTLFSSFFSPPQTFLIITKLFEFIQMFFLPWKLFPLCFHRTFLNIKIDIHIFLTFFCLCGRSFRSNSIVPKSLVRYSAYTKTEEKLMTWTIVTQT